MAKETDLEKCNFWNFQSSVTFDLDHGSGRSHTGAHIRKRSTHTLLLLQLLLLLLLLLHPF